MILDLFVNLVAFTIVMAGVVGAGWVAKWLLRQIIIELGMLSKDIRKTLRPIFMKLAGIFMASYKKSVVCGALYDTILTLATNRVLSYKDHQEICEKLAKALDMPELLPKDIHRLYVKAWLDSKPKMTEFVKPAKPIPGAPNGTYVPAVENIVSYSSFLNALREKQAA